MKYEKAANFSAALHRIFRCCVGALPSVALFRCDFNIGTFFGFIRVYTVVFSDLMFQVISECYERKSLIITSNLEFSGWKRCLVTTA